MAFDTLARAQRYCVKNCVQAVQMLVALTHLCPTHTCTRITGEHAAWDMDELLQQSPLLQTWRSPHLRKERNLIGLLFVWHEGQCQWVKLDLAATVLIVCRFAPLTFSLNLSPSVCLSLSQYMQAASAGRLLVWTLNLSNHIDILIYPRGDCLWSGRCYDTVNRTD